MSDKGPAKESFGLYALLRHFSIDVVAGAVGSAYFASKVIQQELPLVWYVILACAVWLTYTLDHLIDAKRLGARAHTARHRLHHRLFVPLSIVCGIVLAVAVTLALVFLSKELLVAGWITAGLVLAHLFLVWVAGRDFSAGLTKEFGVAVIYTTGIWLPPIFMKVGSVPLWCFIAVGQFFLVASANLHLLSLYERKSDEADKQVNIVLWAGEKASRRLIQLLLTVGLLMGASILYLKFETLPVAAVSILTVIYVAHFQIFFFPEFFRPKERYRAWGDLAFCFTWLILFL